MAKKKTEEAAEIVVSEKKAVDKSVPFESYLEKEYGENICVAGAALASRKKRIVSISPALDVATNGGVPEGSSVLLLGMPKCGKTVTALQIAANAQKLGKKVYFSNIEHRIKPRDLMGIKGLELTPDKFQIIESVKGNILTAEQHLDIIENGINTQPNVVWIIDSVSALLTEKEKNTTMSDQQRAEAAKIMAKLCRKLAAPVGVNDSILISIVHMIANPSGYGSPFQESGGNKVNFASDVKLRAKSFKPWEIGTKENPTQIGQTIEWQVLWSALGRPGAKTTGYLRYGTGLDRVYETIMMAIDSNIIKKGGSWYTFGEDKIQGEENLHHFLTENPDKYSAVEVAVKEMFHLP